MSVEANRQSIVTAIEAAKAAWSEFTLQIEYENQGEIDLAPLVTPYLMVDIVYLQGDQLDLGPTPHVMDYGVIVLAVGTKEGSGTAVCNRLLDHLRPYLQLKDNLGAVRTRAAKIQKPIRKEGFYYIPMVVPFWVVT